MTEHSDRADLQGETRRKARRYITMSGVPLLRRGTALVLALTAMGGPPTSWGPLDAGAQQECVQDVQREFRRVGGPERRQMAQSGQDRAKGNGQDDPYLTTELRPVQPQQNQEQAGRGLEPGGQDDRTGGGEGQGERLVEASGGQNQDVGTRRPRQQEVPGSQPEGRSNKAGAQDDPYAVAILASRIEARRGDDPAEINRPIEQRPQQEASQEQEPTEEGQPSPADDQGSSDNGTAGAQDVIDRGAAQPQDQLGKEGGGVPPAAASQGQPQEAASQGGSEQRQATEDRYAQAILAGAAFADRSRAGDIDDQTLHAGNQEAGSAQEIGGQGEQGQGSQGQSGSDQEQDAQGVNRNDQEQG